MSVFAVLSVLHFPAFGLNTGIFDPFGEKSLFHKFSEPIILGGGGGFAFPDPTFAALCFEQCCTECLFLKLSGSLSITNIVFCS